MIYSRETLKYISTAFNVTCFDTGLRKVNGIEEAYSKGPRGKVIAKIDLVNTLSEWFSEDTISMTRNSLLCIAQGTCNSETMSKLISIYIKADAKFRRSINILFSDCPHNYTFGGYISSEFAKAMLDFQNEIKTRFVGRSEYYISESDGYLYFSFPDIENYNFNMYPYEVISDAKNWSFSNKG